jgi:type IV secretion system protein VirB4
MPTATHHLKQRNSEKRESAVASHVPYTRHVSPTTIRTRQGYFIQVIEVTGMSFETQDQEFLDARKMHRSMLWQGIADTHLAIYTHIIRKRIDSFPEGTFSSPWAAELDQQYRNRLREQRMFGTRQYITVVRRPAKGKVHFIPQLTQKLLARVDRQIQAEQEREALEHLGEATGHILRNFAPYGARVLQMGQHNGVLHSEIQDFLSYLINLEDGLTLVPSMPLSDYLPHSRISFGSETLEIRGVRPGQNRLGAILSIKEFPPATGSGMLDSILRLPHEFIITQSFSFTGRHASQTAIDLHQRRLRSVDDRAMSADDELSLAANEIASNISIFGNMHLTIMPYAANATTLKKAINDISAACMETGISPVREDMNMEALFWAQLPGNFKQISRKWLLTNKNFAGFSSFHTFPNGKIEGNHWGQAVSLLATTSSTPYYFNFHERDVGNFTLIGPTGTGKTVLLSFLVAQAQRLNPRTVYFDKDRGAELFIRAIGGEYHIVQQGMPTGLNPFLLADTPVNRAFLVEFIKVLATVDYPEKLTPADEQQIVEAVKANYEVEPQYRSLQALSGFFSGYVLESGLSLSRRLEKWHSGGERAWLFDNQHDSLSLENLILGFDLTSILDIPYARIPWLMYVFHRVDSLLDGTRTIIMLDEGWKLLDDEVFAARIKDWEKTIRKQNGLLGFATQSPSDAISSKVGKAIIEQSPTKLFLPNPNAQEEDYCKGFGLTQQELQIIRLTPPESRTFLLKHGNHSVLATLDLKGMEDYVSILSGRTETVLLAEAIRAEVGDDPADWLPIFQQRRHML